MRQFVLPSASDLGEIVANSYADFHAKGVHYLCLKRSPAETLKVYFFEGDVAAAPEVAIPHDHRYDFETYILSGASLNRTFVRGSEADGGRCFEEFDYRTRLNGGDGFTWKREAWLRQSSEDHFLPRTGYAMRSSFIHTIAITAPDTVLVLRQLEDVVPHGAPTTAFRPAGMREGPNLDGLYRRMTEDEALYRVRLYRDLVDRFGEAA